MVMGEPISMLSTIVTFVQLILAAEATARHNKRKCRDLADRVRILAHLVPGSISASSAPALHRLNAALGEAHTLVESCGGRRGGARFFNFSGRRKAARLEDVERRINGCILDLNLDRQDKLAENIARQGKLVGELALDARDLRRAALAPRAQVPVRALPPAVAERATATRFAPSSPATTWEAVGFPPRGQGHLDTINLGARAATQTALPPAVAERATATRFAPSSPARTWEAVGFPPHGQGHLDTINLGVTQTALPAGYSNKANDPYCTNQNQELWKPTVLPAAYSNQANDPYGTNQNQGLWKASFLAAAATRTHPAPATMLPAAYNGNTSWWPHDPALAAAAYTAVPTFSRSVSSSGWGSHLFSTGPPPYSSQHAAMFHYPSTSSSSVYSAPPPSSHTIRSAAMSARSSLRSSRETSSASSSTRSGFSSSMGSSLAVSSLSSTTGSSSAPSSLRGSDRSSHFISKSRISNDTSSRVSSDSRMSADTSSRSTYYSRQRSSDSSSCVSRCSSDLSYRYRVR